MNFTTITEIIAWLFIPVASGGLPTLQQQLPPAPVQPVPVQVRPAPVRVPVPAQVHRHRPARVQRQPYKHGTTKYN